MTSKEALTQLYIQVHKRKRRTRKEIIDGHEQYEKIYKDLVVLDILKKCNNEINTLYYGCVFNARLEYKITDKECKLVKEWLKE